MKHIGILAALVITAVVSSLTCGCGGKTADIVSVQGAVSKEAYVNMMSGGFGMDGLPIAYHVTVHLQNPGTEKFLFDEIQGAFVPSQGQPLIQRTFAYDKSKGESPDAYQTGSNRPSVLEPGKSLDFDYTTDGYTME